MTGRTHALVGVNTVWTLWLANGTFSAWLVPVAAFAALLPDLDASESMIKHLHIGVGSGKRRVSVQPFAPLALLFSTLFRHRGWLHSWLAIVCVAGLSVVFTARFGPEYPVVITLAYCSHLFIDALTTHGIEFLLPLPTRCRVLPKALRAKTGGVLDHALFVLGAMGFVTLVLFVLRAGD